MKFTQTHIHKTIYEMILFRERLNVIYLLFTYEEDSVFSFGTYDVKTLWSRHWNRKITPRNRHYFVNDCPKSKIIAQSYISDELREMLSQVFKLQFLLATFRINFTVWKCVPSHKCVHSIATNDFFSSLCVRLLN